MSSKQPPHRHPNVDVCMAAHAVLEALPAIAAYRDRAAKLLEFDVRCFDTLATTATNALEASRYLDDVRCRADLAIDPSVSLAASLRAECDRLRAILTAAADAGVFPSALAALIPTARTDIELANEARELCRLDLARLTHEHDAARDEARLLFGMADLANQLDALMRQASPEKTMDAGTQCRDTAFARLAAQYAEVRRAIEYLRPRRSN